MNAEKRTAVFMIRVKPSSRVFAKQRAKQLSSEIGRHVSAAEYVDCLIGDAHKLFDLAQVSPNKNVSHKKRAS